MNILSDLLLSPVASRLERIFDRFYAKHVEESIPYGFRSLVFVLRLAGLWPTAYDPDWYKWLTIAYFFSVCICYPLSIFVNGSIVGIMDNLFLLFGGLAIGVKAGALYGRHHKIRVIFRLHAGLLPDASRDQAADNHFVASINFYIHTTLTAFYSAMMCEIVLQMVFSKPEDRFYSSTLLLPYDLAQRRTVYLIVLVYQIWNSWLYIITVATQDSLFVAMVNTVCGHVRQLKERLRHLGEDDGDNSKFYKDLMDCCKRYEECLSFAELIGQVESIAFFAQFGVSGIVLCSTMFLLSVINPSDDLLKFITVTVFFLGVLVQILVSCCIGHWLTDTFDGLTYAIYQSPWLDRDEKCKRALRILTERSMRPLTIYAGGLYDLSLQTFVKICRAAFSYFNVLQTLNSKMS